MQVYAYPRGDELEVYVSGQGQHIWKTKDPVTPAMTKNGPAMKREIKRVLRGTNIRIVVGDGSGTVKLDPRAKMRNGRVRGKKNVEECDIYMAFNGGVSMTFEEWDDLWQEIDIARTDLPK